MLILRKITILDIDRKRCEMKIMPPKLETGTSTERLQLVAPSSWMARIDEWRSRQRPIPNKSEAIRLLVDIALDQTAERSETPTKSSS